MKYWLITLICVSLSIPFILVGIMFVSSGDDDEWVDLLAAASEGFGDKILFDTTTPDIKIVTSGIVDCNFTIITYADIACKDMELTLGLDGNLHLYGGGLEDFAIGSYESLCLLNAENFTGNVIVESKVIDAD